MGLEPGFILCEVIHNNETPLAKASSHFPSMFETMNCLAKGAPGEQFYGAGTALQYCSEYGLYSDISCS